MSAAQLGILLLPLAMAAAGCVESHDVEPCPYHWDTGAYSCVDAGSSVGTNNKTARQDGREEKR